MAHIDEFKRNPLKYVHSFSRIGQIYDSSNGGIVVRHTSESSLGVKVKSKQNLDPLSIELKESVL